MIKRRHATSSQPSPLTPHPRAHPLKPREAFPMTSGYTTLIPFQWQNPLLTDQLNSHSQAQKTKSQTQHKTWVTPHAGHLAQMRGRQVINMAPQRSQCHTGNMSGSRAVTREQDDNVLSSPVAVPVSSVVFQTTE